MNTILVAILLLTDLITYIVFLDVILSWLTLFGLKFRPKFLGDILDPIYTKIKDTIPTTIGPLDLTPIIIIFLMMFIKGIIFSFDPGVGVYYNELISF